MANIRIKCSCGSRLKAPGSAAGGQIRCWHCGVKLTVPGRPAPAAGLGPDELSFVLDQAKPWIRVTCECGKTIKSPPDWVGKQGTCPRCNRGLTMIADPPGSNAQRPGEANTKIGLTPDDIFADMHAMNNAEGDQKMKSSATLDAIAVPAETVTDPRTLASGQPSKPGFPGPGSGSLPASQAAHASKIVQPAVSTVGKDQFIRVTCVCGKVVKAPLDWAGTMGSCPRCGKKILMPKVDDEVLAEVRKSPAPSPSIQSEQPFDPEASAVMDSILSQEDVVTLTAQGVTGEDWEKKKQDRLREWQKR